MNKIIRNLTIENFLNLKASFDTSKKIFWNEEKNRLVHAGEYGIYREELVKRWLRMYIPKRFEISSGFLINSENKISSQCDIVIYDRNTTPQIESLEKQSFFPIETVAVVIEIKSDINSAAELNTHLAKLSEIKKLREEVKNPRPYYRNWNKGDYDSNAHSVDNVGTILICNKLNFDLSNDPINYECETRHKHNLILSLQDIFIGYQDQSGLPNIPFPFFGSNLCSTSFAPAKNDGEEFPEFIGIFLTAFQMLLDFTTILELDMAYYYSDNYYESSKKAI